MIDYYAYACFLKTSILPKTVVVQQNGHTTGEKWPPKKGFFQDSPGFGLLGIMGKGSDPHFQTLPCLWLVAAVMFTTEQKIFTAISFFSNQQSVVTQRDYRSEYRTFPFLKTVQNIVNKFKVHDTVLNGWKGNLGRNKTLLGGPLVTCGMSISLDNGKIGVMRNY